MSLSDDDESLRHIARTPLPWRPAERTVCGKVAADFRAELVLSLEDAIALRKRLGKQRFALVICMTCAHHVNGWVKWEDNPTARMARELTWPSDAQPLIVAELRAIAALIDLHRADFDELVRGFMSGDVTSLADLRRTRARRG